MTQTNGEAFTIRGVSALLGQENPTTGSASESYYGLTGEVLQQGFQRSPRPWPRMQTPRREVQLGLSPDTRTAARTSWKNAQKAAESMVAAAETDKLMQKTCAADELELSLAELWKSRGGRDINWQTIINHAQGLLRQAFQEKRVEQLTVEQCAAIQTIVDRYLGTSTKSVDDLHEVVGLIEKAGFDPYFAISGDPVDDQDLEPQG
jgi:hypothetical protein